LGCVYAELVNMMSGRRAIRWLHLLLLSLALALVAPGSAYALSLTYNGSILKPDGTPLSGSVAFNVAVKSSAGCVIYRETQSSTVTSGAFALSLNSGSSTVVHGSSAIFDTAFTNSGTFSCEGGGTFTPGASAPRALGVTFTPPAAAPETLADQAIALGDQPDRGDSLGDAPPAFTLAALPALPLLIRHV
jgi:hypothetical protein